MHLDRIANNFESGTQNPANAYTDIAANCWCPQEKSENKDCIQSETKPDSGKTLDQRVADFTPPISEEDVAKLSEGIAKDLIADRNLGKVGGMTFGYSSAIQSAWIEAGPKGVKQLVEKINKDLKALGSDLTLSIGEPQIEMGQDGHDVAKFKLTLKDSNGELENKDYSLGPYAQRFSSKEQVDAAIPLLADIVKSGSFGEHLVKEFMENMLTSAMKNGNLDEVVKKINAQLAGTDYQLNAKTETWEKHSNKFGEFNHQRTDTVNAQLIKKSDGKPVDTVSGSVYYLGVINNNIDPPRRWRDDQFPDRKF